MASIVVARARVRPGAEGLVLRALLIAGGAAVLGWWAWSGTRTGTHGLAGAITSLGRVAGLLAAYLCLVLVLLIARVPWFERAVGLDRLVGWHRALGTNTVILMAAHIGLIVWGYGISDDLPLTTELWTIVSTYPAMIRATIGTVLFLLVAMTSGSLMRRHLSYELWWTVHLTTYAAILLTFGHQLSNGEDFIGHPRVQLVWLIAYVVVFGSVLWWRVLDPLILSASHALRVDQVVQESPDTASIWLRGDALTSLRVRGGQFLILRFLAPGLWSSGHPYSISSIAEADRVRITIRTDGDHSARIARLRPGTWAVFEGPYGAFTTRPAREQAPALLLAGGVGVAPMVPIAAELANNGHQVVAVVRDSSRHVLVDDLEELPGIEVHSLLGRRADLGHDPMTRLPALVPDAATRDVWICGPPGFAVAAIRACHDLGIPDHHMHLEDFAW
ncbi:MAG: ferredoxin reductase family protein [Nocardioides sp.]|uniref:ferredoxin reductase family protein n=1 Tax=Nocardioides sp. TaxID=35761 RepID=UPI0039E5D3A4